MKRAVIQYILKFSSQTGGVRRTEGENITIYTKGIHLLQKVNPHHPLINQPYTDQNQHQLLQILGHYLRTNQLEKVIHLNEGISKPIADLSQKESPLSSKEADGQSGVGGARLSGEEINQSSTNDFLPSPQRRGAGGEEFTGDLSTEARLNMDIARMIKMLRAQSMKLHQAQSDQERKLIYAESNKINSSIEQSKALLRQLSKGNKVNYVNTYFEAEDESDFDIPDKIIDIDKKYRSMMQKRSKRLAKAEQKRADHGQDSPQHQQALAEWKHYDEVVKHFKTKLDELTNTGS